MITSFANKVTEDVFNGIHSHTVKEKLPSEIVKVAQRRLDELNCVSSLDQLKAIPAIKTEAAVRDSKDTYSIPIEGNTRIAFRWNHGGAEDVEIRV